MFRILMVFLLGLVALAGPLQAEDKFLPRDKAEITMSFAPLVKRTAPAVVNVYAKTIQREQQQAGGPFDDPFFRQFFGLNSNGPPRERIASSLGSGVIVNPNGTIITNNHVIKNATDIRVALADKREFPAKVILADERTDLAVLKIDVADENLPVLPLANSDDLEVGDLVLAIGDPFGVGQTVTSGIISALARNNVGISDYQFFIQTDAAINPGNSGGALVNMKGELIGINTAIFSKSGGSIGIGFSIPSNMVATVIQSAQSGKAIQRPWLGGEFQNITQDLADSLGLSRPEGVLVTNLSPQSPLTKAGLKRGDVLMAFDGKTLDNAQALNYLLGTSRVGDSKLIEYRRGEASLQATLKMVAAPETVAREQTEITGNNPFAGMVVANLSPAVADELNIPADATGVVIVDVKNGAAAKFVQKGDIVREVNGQKIDTVASLNTMINQSPRRWVIGFERAGQLIYLRLGQ
jgi:Do/DeqQ family serine protease